MSLLSRPMMQGRPALALATALALCSPAHAAFTVYTDEASFLAAVGEVQVQDFNAYSTDVAASGADLGDFSVNGNASLDAPDTTYPVNGTANLRINTSYGGWADLRFDNSLVAFGAWFYALPSGHAIRVDADSLQGYGSYRHVGQVDIGAGATLRFIGVTSDSPFNRLIFLGQGCCSSGFALDDVAYASSLSPVPEPASAALLLAGAGWLGWRRRSR